MERVSQGKKREGNLQEVLNEATALLKRLTQ
jgi:hypothetical protein